MEYAVFKIKNYKGIDNLEIDFSKSPKGNIYTFVGLNESGKTTILEAINFFSKDDKNIKALYADASNKYNYQDFIPKKSKSNFTGEILIKAICNLSEKDISLIQQFTRDNYSKIIDESKLGKRFSISIVLNFEDSVFVKRDNLWAIHIACKSNNKNAKKYRKLDADDEAWHGIVDYIQSMLPKINYYPTFLFDFPSKIFLEPSDDETDANVFYKDIIQEILDSLNEGLNIDKHIVQRFRKSQDSTVNVFNPMTWFQGDEKEQVDAVLLKASEKVTNIVFESWNKIFNRRLTNKTIVISLGIDTSEGGVDSKVYLRFNVKDGDTQYGITERSLGFRWFFCFLLFTQFSNTRRINSSLFLFDEPASNLHAKAQMQLLDSFPNITDNDCKIVYSTHSHYLINPKWLENTFIVRNSGVDYDDGEIDATSGHTNIEIDSYRNFVGQNPEKLTYFQPILDALDYKPSLLEHERNGVMVEGKIDFYILKYFSDVIFNNIFDIKIIPGIGAHDLNGIISLYLSEGKNFIIMLDSDKAGLSSKANYLDEWLLGDDKVFTMSDINTAWMNFKIESLFHKDDLKLISDAIGSKNRLKKKDIARFIQEKLALNEVINFSNSTKDNFKEYFDFLIDKFASQNA